MRNIATVAWLLMIALSIAVPAQAHTWRDYLLEVGRKIDGQGSSGPSSHEPSADGAPREAEPKPTALPLMSELDGMVGIEGVTNVLRNNCAQFAVQRKNKTKPRVPLHVAFVGPAGSGKTEVAQHYARALHAVGATKKASVLVATQADLVAEYLGKTPSRTQNFLAPGRGGTIVIDRVGSMNLQRERQDHDYGGEALGVIKKAMEDWSDDTVFILVDSKPAMDALRNHRSGILQRVPQTVLFPQLTAEQLLDVLKRRAATAGFSLSERVIALVRPQLAAVARRENGGGSAKVRQMLDNAVMHWQTRQTAGHVPGTAAELAAEDFDITQSSASRRPVGERVARARAVLNRLNDMPGLDELHEQLQAILDELAFDLKNQDGLAGTHRGLNMAFVGPPGTGKTTVAQIFGEALKELGVLQTDTFLIRRPADLISEEGRTGAKARDALDEGRGGITFIDEAYGLVAHRDARPSVGAIASVYGERARGQCGDLGGLRARDGYVVRLQSRFPSAYQ